MPVMVFFFSQSRPRPPPCHIGSPPRFGFSTVDPPTCTRSIWRKKVEFQDGDSKTLRISKGIFSKQARYRESGPASGLCHVCTFGRRADEKTWKTWETWDCERRLTDLAVNFLADVTHARAAEGAASTRRPVPFGAANPNGRVGTGRAPGEVRRSGASEASGRRAARRHRRASRRLVFRNRVTSLGGARRRRALARGRARAARGRRQGVSHLVAGMLKKCNYQGEPRESPRARQLEEPRDVTAIGRRGFSTAVDPPRARARTAFRLTLPSPNVSPNPSQSPRRAAARRRWLSERGTQFNLLLTDVMMSDVDGPTLLHSRSQQPFYQEMPVVMMSSNEHADTVMNCIRLGAEDYLSSRSPRRRGQAHVGARLATQAEVPDGAPVR